MDNFVSQDECRGILAIASDQTSERLKLIDPDKSTEEKIVRMLDERRITERVDMSTHQEVLDTFFLRQPPGYAVYLP